MTCSGKKAVSSAEFCGFGQVKRDMRGREDFPSHRCYITMEEEEAGQVKKRSGKNSMPKIKEKEGIRVLRWEWIVIVGTWRIAFRLPSMF